MPKGGRMAKYLVIVESPAKAKTIGGYLGKDYQVKASVGHVRDLPPKGLGVDIEHGFRPTYQLVRGKGTVIDEIRQASQRSDLVYLATDPDREGEAIAWHVAEAAKLDEAKTQRIAFHQVTKAAVQEALANPRGLDRELIDAQQARRVLDRLVGYQISPILSKTLRRRLSAGRVQSVALRLVVEREREILAFVPEEYWTLDAELARRTVERERFTARLLKISGMATSGDRQGGAGSATEAGAWAKDPELPDREAVDRLLAALDGATYTVTRVQKGERRRNPQPPFITSTLQADAGRKLHYSPRQTMRLAQQLYEGIELEDETVGLITYMRTDSTHVAPEAQAEARQFVAERWGQEYLPTRPPSYRSKTANAQEAHEAIRPTSVQRTPESVRPHLDARQFRLYELIWQRFLASQMMPARYATMTVDVTATKDAAEALATVPVALFRATGSTLIFPGYLVAYTEGRDEEWEPASPVPRAEPQARAEEPAQALPPLIEGEELDLLQLLPAQHFTQPPPRYTEPTLIQALEANGVGRPSTYAAMVTVIQDRGYVVKEGANHHSPQSLMPTPLGMVVCDALVATFEDIMDVSYTASMEERLDQIARGELQYRAMMSDFYRGFEPQLQSAREGMAQAVEAALWADLPPEVREQRCPECGSPMQVRISSAGRFLGCTRYPECRGTLDLSAPDQPGATADVASVDAFAEGETCERCGGRMKIISRGRNRFLGCENYPACKNTRSILSDEIKRLAAETACPTCGQQPLTPKKGRYGEYLRCDRCAVNYSLRKLGLAPPGSDTPSPRPRRGKR